MHLRVFIFPQDVVEAEDEVQEVDESGSYSDLGRKGEGARNNLGRTWRRNMKESQQLNSFQVLFHLHTSLSHLFKHSISPGRLRPCQLCLLSVQALIGKCWKMPCARRLSGRRSSRPARTKHWKCDEQKCYQQSKYMQDVPLASPKMIPNLHSY